MDNEKLNLYDSLLQWFKILNLSAPHSNASDLSDGVAVAEALHQIASETFTELWLSKIKIDVGGNWRLKMSNMKKVIEGVYDYYVDVLNLNLLEFARPDVQKIAEKGDELEIGRLLQLVLGCAVNCLQKQTYITQIMDVEESLQQNIMRALQDLEYIWQGSTSSRGSLSLANFDSKALQDERDSLAQKCHEAERRITFLLEEKSSLQQELQRLQADLEKYDNQSTFGDDGTSIGPIQLGSSRYNELRKQMDSLKEELLQAETSRDDYKMKSQQQEKEIILLQTKMDDFHQTSSELSNLKDEIDALREASDKLKICEAQLATYKKKLEDHNDLKKQVKMLEERSADYIQQNLHFEEDIKKFAELKGQVDLYKKEIQDLHEKLDTEMSRSMKIEFEMKNVESKLTAIQRERDNLLTERDVLRETCDELTCNQLGTSGSDADNTMSKELMSPGMKDKVERLVAENKALREGQGGQTALAQLLDDSNQRMEKLREQLKTANQKILLLTQSQGDEPKGDLVVQLRQSLELNDQKSTQIDELQSQVTTMQGKLNQFETVITTKDQELSAADLRYRKCLEKAKEVIKSLDPRAANEATLLEKAHDTNNDPEPRTPMGPVEEQLVTTAFYHLGFACQREAVEARLALLSGPGQSFLARQRQPPPRKPVNMINQKAK